MLGAFQLLRAITTESNKVFFSKDTTEASAGQNLAAMIAAGSSRLLIGHQKSRGKVTCAFQPQFLPRFGVLRREHSTDKILHWRLGMLKS
ncbi:hypothetical protein SIAM614_00964 [Stappia aggregata IAM 12614]|uniref:Uncharacterized protein n=1 Tax=Roseibium aggregatum (strain ATCC 25650 / DSM 13394 / JCM 20685 / NBRC 16684 / NCIMB 2208 / IAM 12614 / B1) TaxID=384765 RepID=A0P0K3_ROSAI|nr:hypothetical protein SIAM614_00964 [Stappia aggregata IAM 12614] [Roseibium aggregatum IAM 12614]